MHTSYFTLLKVKEVLPTEQHFSESAKELSSKILKCEFWTNPILVLDAHLVVLDGHHRLDVARNLGLQVIPSVVVRADDPALSLCCWRQGEFIKIEEVISRGQAGDLFPPKTTKFTLTGGVPQCRFSIEELKRC